MSSSCDLKCALIWWVDHEEIEIIPCEQLPIVHNGVGSIVELMWEDTEISDAKILAFADSEDELKEVIVDNDGNICSANGMFPAVKRRCDILEQNEKLKLPKTFVDEEEENMEYDEDLPLLNLEPSTSTLMLRLPKPGDDSDSSDFENESQYSSEPLEAILEMLEQQNKIFLEKARAFCEEYTDQTLCNEYLW